MIITDSWILIDLELYDGINKLGISDTGFDLNQEYGLHFHNPIKRSTSYLLFYKNFKYILRSI